MSKKNIFYYFKNYKFNSIVFKYFITITMIITVPIGVISIMFYNNIKETTQNQLFEMNLSKADKTMSVISNLFKEMEHIATNFTLQEDINRFMLFENNDKVTQFNIQKLIKNYTLIYKYIDSINVFSDTSNQVISNSGIESADHFKANKAYEMYQNDINSKFELVRNNHYYTDYITFVKPYRISNEEKTGAVIINLSIEELKKYLDSSLEGKEFIFIINNENKIIYNDNSALIEYDASSVEIISRISKMDSGCSVEIDVDRAKYIASIIDSDKYNLKFISVKNIQKDVLLNTDSVFIFNIVLWGILINLIISIVISLKAYKPVQNIIELLDDNGDEGVVNFLNSNKKNELNYILRNIIDMKGTNREIKVQLNESVEKFSKMHYAMLQAQINPHFLCNTLEIINWMAFRFTNSKNDVSESVRKLSLLYRQNIESNDFLILFKSEIDYAKTYISLLELRYKDMFSVKWEIQPEVEAYKIVKLSLQPLLENAMYHGIKPKREFGEIFIRAKLVNNEKIEIEIEDNGVGISAEKLAALNASVREFTNFDETHIGIKNVNQRMQIIYGNNFGLNVESVENKGTKIKISIPAIKY